VVSRGLYIYVARLWIHGALNNQPDSGFTGLIYLYHPSADSRGSCLLSITGLTVGSWSPGEVLSVLYSLLSSRQEREFYLCLVLPAFTLFVIFVFPGMV
jgi:hypothetical protein